MLEERQKNEKGESVLVASYCFDIDEAYNWFITRNQEKHPYIGRKITRGERGALLARYKDIYPPARQCDLTIYHSQYHGNPVVAIMNPRVPNQWIVFPDTKEAYEKLRRFKLSPTILTPSAEGAQGSAYQSLQQDKVLLEKQLTTTETIQELMAILKQHFLMMQRPEIRLSKQRPIQVYKDILQWNDEGTPVSTTVGGRGHTKQQTIKDLQARCRAHGIPYSGLRKAELVAALQRR